MFSIRVYNRDAGEFEDIEFNENDILSFGITNDKLWNKNGTFKKFNKKAFVELKDHTRYKSYDTNVIKELKTVLKGKFDTKKYEKFEYKNYSERKAIDWTYTIKDLAITESK